MERSDTPALLTADPINISYTTGVRNMTVFSMMGAFRLLLVRVDATTVLWEFGGSEHLADGFHTIGEVRRAPGLTPMAGPDYQSAAREFANEVASLVPGVDRLAVERVDHPVTDGLRATGFGLTSATEVFVDARRIKLPSEIDVMRDAIDRVEAGLTSMLAGLAPGRSEVEIWADFHRHLIATEGEYISTRLVQSGERTFPYFNEAGSRQLENGDLFCIDTDAIGYGGYGVDFSRTFLCGDRAPTPTQQSLHAMAVEQLHHNADLLGPGVGYASFAERAWSVPEVHKPYGYYCLAHGLGLCGEFPYVPVAEAGVPYTFAGEFEPGMIMCVESYIGDPDSHQGVKVEDQYLITDAGAERLTTLPHALV